MRIRVTRRDIERGERGNSFYCAVALAADRATGKCCLVNFTDQARRRLVLVLDGVGVAAVLPPEARRWVKDYDAGRRVRPRTFAVKLKRR